MLAFFWLLPCFKMCVSEDLIHLSFWTPWTTNEVRELQAHSSWQDYAPSELLLSLCCTAIYHQSETSSSWCISVIHHQGSPTSNVLLQVWCYSVRKSSHSPCVVSEQHERRQNMLLKIDAASQFHNYVNGGGTFCLLWVCDCVFKEVCLGPLWLHCSLEGAGIDSLDGWLEGFNGKL